MARFRCRACGQEGEFTYIGGHECPRCGSADVQFALGIDEMPVELIDRIIESLSQAESLDETPTDEEDR
ncbi:hydrogenase maturation nickel metallochaperone HypA [Bradyrhizobium sp. CCGUVB1N3]|uniref:hydrogenase maturation nickel metallochaperone HypA n=1 Tax=Bradyrhizobium sp. CCGUVB1N3 TaxID=2949629 RepID=UPI0020B333D9|nr:hydrogenase maturation nickel metallochaperone HypA [Bradyrhizobium sp. CCGUVB1N3]MCP3471815.1 hydrogenase maturation nickel metallochaperone HypA [Bradyrhizobium sp. CCGUVB1N3]MCP3473597.1 hydrogenase maturation nickel metallochaperone HypA [Bradyrhizobium sp. CCGUVB1N3]